MKLFIEPVDVWMFRDGRPFDAGSDHQAASLFPPHPSVIQGVLRSHHLVVKKVDLTDGAAVEAAVGTATAYRWYPIRGPFVARKEGDRVWRYHPLPADATRGGDGAEVRAAAPIDPAEHGVLTDRPTPLLLWPEGNPRKGEGKLWLREDELLRYLRRERARCLPARDLFRLESRFGIGRDDRVRGAAEGLLYEARYVRPADGVGLEVEVLGLADWPDQGVLRMGGEGRAGAYSPSNSPGWPVPPDPLPDRFRVYLATPAYFRDGWRPQHWGAFFEGELQLMAAAIARYEAVGGYDIARGAQKPSRRYVPAGSVYYFVCNGPVRWRRGPADTALTDEGAEMGYGQFLIGGW
jgi:CRISPR-associated protein Cmr3